MAERELDAATGIDLEALHSYAQRTVTAYRQTSDGWDDEPRSAWGDYMETALVAAADAQHPNDGRVMANEAFDQLLGWLDSPITAPRRLGDDAAAVALTARVARELRGGDSHLVHQAAQLTQDVCQSRSDLAPLHLALIAWALDPVIPDREREPWNAIRGVIPGLNRLGINDALLGLAEALARQDAPAVDARIAYASAEQRDEQCILVWILGEAITLDIARGHDTQDELAPFSERRTGLLTRLVTELATRPTGVVDVQDFDPEEELYDEEDGLPLFEALMLDLSLSGPPAARRMLTEAQADARTERATRSARRLFVVGLASISVTIAAFAAVIGILAHASTHLWTGIAVVIACLGLSLAVRVGRASTTYNVSGLLLGLWLEALVGALLICEGAFGWPHVADDVALIVGLVAVGAPPLLQPFAEQRDQD